MERIQDYLRDRVRDNNGNSHIGIGFHPSEEGFRGIVVPLRSFHSQSCPLQTRFDEDKDNLRRMSVLQPPEIERSRQ